MRDFLMSMVKLCTFLHVSFTIRFHAFYTSLPFLCIFVRHKFFYQYRSISVTDISVFVHRLLRSLIYCKKLVREICQNFNKTERQKIIY